MASIALTDQEFESKVLQSQSPVLVDFWAPWCGPCQMIGPFIDKVAEDFAGDVVVYKVNVDENPSISSQLGVRSIPYLVIFKNGEIVNEVVGAPDPQKLVDMLEASLS